MKRGIGFLVLLGVVIGICICRAQMAVQSRVDNRVAGTGADATLRYSQVQTSRMMPSEMRQAYWQSGMLPSEVRGNYLRLGPMTNQGQAAYFQKPNQGGSGSSYKSSRTDTLVQPTWGGGSRPMASASGSSSSIWGSAGSAGSVRYSSASRSTAVASTQIQPKMVGSVRFDSRVN